MHFMWISSNLELKFCVSVLDVSPSPEEPFCSSHAAVLWESKTVHFGGVFVCVVCGFFVWGVVFVLSLQYLRGEFVMWKI